MLFCVRASDMMVVSLTIAGLCRYKDAKEVYASRKYEMFFWDNKATLAIKDTEPSDTGRYRCEVSNRLGRVESTGNLSVYSTWPALCIFQECNLVVKLCVIVLS